MHPARLAPLLLAVGLLACAAGAAALVAVQATPGTVEVGVRSPAVEFQKGEGAAKGRHVEGLALSPNLTSFSAGLRAKSGAEMHVKDLVRLASKSPQARTVTLRADPVTDASVLAFAWTVRDGATVVALVDHRTALPTATFTVPADATYTFDLWVHMAERSSTRVPFSLRLEVA